MQKGWDVLLVWASSYAFRFSVSGSANSDLTTLRIFFFFFWYFLDLSYFTFSNQFQLDYRLPSRLLILVSLSTL